MIAATPELAADLAARLSPDHAREVRDVSGVDPASAVTMSLAASVEAYAYLPPGSERALFMMGVERAGAVTNSALLWMLGSAAASRRPAAVLRAARWGVGRAFRATGADRLEQYIPGWYRTGLRFAARMGFAMEETPMRSRSGAALWRIVLIRNTPGKG